MADDFSRLTFDDDLAEALQVEDAAQRGWIIERVAELEIYATLSPGSRPTERFQARLLWDVYPANPPSLKFRDPLSGRLDLKSAWPVVQGYRPDQLDACVNWTSEGFVTHPEWKADANARWNPKGNAVLRVLRLLQKDLDDRYTGRAQ
jgi:hypothetical protein